MGEGDQRNRAPARRHREAWLPSILIYCAAACSASGFDRYAVEATAVVGCTPATSVVSLQHIAAIFRAVLCYLRGGAQNDFQFCWRKQTARGAMDELVGRIVTNVGIERPVAERAVG